MQNGQQQQRYDLPLYDGEPTAQPMTDAQAAQMQCNNNQQPVNPMPIQQNPNYNQNQMQQAGLPVQQQQNQGNFQAQKIYPTHIDGLTDPVQIQCRKCKIVGLTRVEQNTCNIVSCLWFWCTSWTCFCCFIPGCCKTQTEFNHYCYSCGTKLGKKEAECC